MSDPQSENILSVPVKVPGEAPVASPPRDAAPAEASEEAVSSTASGVSESPIKEKTAGGPPRERRDFFGEAVREMLLPLSGLIERKIHPLLAALEQIPDDAERLASTNFGLLDQRQTQVSHLPVHPSPERYLRPPGAMTAGGEGGFESVCSRCGKCVEACPAAAIKLDPGGLAADGFPYIVAESQPCVVCEDLACMKSCSTGALRLVDRLQIKMGTAEVDHRICLRDHGEGCTLCIDVCPVDGKSAGTLSALFISPESGRIRVRKNVCIGCGLCENRCPTEPRAIVVAAYVAPIDPIIA